MKRLVFACLTTLAGVGVAAPALAAPSITLDLSPAYPDHAENPGGTMSAWCLVQPDGTNPDALRILVEDPAGDVYAEWVYPGATEWTLDWTVPSGVTDGIWTYRVEYYSDQGLAASIDEQFLVAGATTGICAFKYFDANGNATLDDGEELLAGWEICFEGPGGVECEVTDEDGVACIFFIPAGAYEICETLQDGWESTTGVCTEIQVSSSIEKALFGNIPVVPTVESSWGEIKSIYR